jgi:DnaJ-class molecular chaperone
MTLQQAKDDDIPAHLLTEIICRVCRGSGEGRGGSLTCERCGTKGTEFVEIEEDEENL